VGLVTLSDRVGECSTFDRGASRVRLQRLSFLPGVSLTARTEVGNRLARQNIPAKLRTIVELAGLFLTLYLSDTLSLEAIPDDVHFPERRASHGVEIHPEVLTRLLPALLVGFAQIVSAPAKCL
jgi:hypothetical protein